PTPLAKVLWQKIGVHDDDAVICRDKHGNPEPDPALRDTEIVTFDREIEEYFSTEVLPHVPDAWIDPTKTRTGYEIPFTRLFYTYVPPRPLDEIDAELDELAAEIVELLRKVES